MTKQTRREFLRSTGAVAAVAAIGSALPVDAPADDRPNILLLFPDQHRFDWTGLDRALPVRTPNLDKLAASGVRFTNALTPSPLCAPARACLAAGKEYGNCRVGSNKAQYPIDQTTFYTLLRDSGYHVMGCGKFDLHKATPTWGIDGKNMLKEWGFSHGIDSAGKHDAINSGRVEPKDPFMAMLEKRGLRLAHIEDFKKRGEVGKSAVFPSPLPDDAYGDNWVGQNGIDLIRKAPKGKPWFLQVNFPGPHEPWDITKSMDELYKGVDLPQPNGNTQLKTEEHVGVRRNYSAMVTNIDCWTGIYLDELAKRGELDNTIVIYSSDHGEMLGDHNAWGKSVPFHASVCVPLVVAGPGVRTGFVAKSPTSTMDLAATCLELAGAKCPDDMDSKSFLPLLKGGTDKHREVVLSGLRKWRSVFDGRYKLTRGFSDVETEIKLYDLDADPLENKDISEANPQIVERLSKLLT
jgi:arylsulfatase A-like enzyme